MRLPGRGTGDELRAHRVVVPDRGREDAAGRRLLLVDGRGRRRIRRRGDGDRRRRQDDRVSRPVGGAGLVRAAACGCLGRSAADRRRPRRPEPGPTAPADLPAPSRAGGAAPRASPPGWRRAGCRPAAPRRAPDSARETNQGTHASARFQSAVVDLGSSSRTCRPSRLPHHRPPAGRECPAPGKSAAAQNRDRSRVPSQR